MEKGRPSLRTGDLWHNRYLSGPHFRFSCGFYYDQTMLANRAAVIIEAEK
ncbi:hypothetical protein SOV_16490 [Sporomusa ovata DSM 2662]|nr:hypothetical protein SOV_1c09820 [Sporomusa ovata DSM 2662]